MTVQGARPSLNLEGVTQTLEPHPASLRFCIRRTVFLMQTQVPNTINKSQAILRNGFPFLLPNHSGKPVRWLRGSPLRTNLLTGCETQEKVWAQRQPETSGLPSGLRQVPPEVTWLCLSAASPHTVTRDGIPCGEQGDTFSLMAGATVPRLAKETPD